MESKSSSAKAVGPAQKEPIATTIFVGFPLAADLAYELIRSPKWKNALITRPHHPDEIQEIVFQDKKYVGRYIQKDRATVEELELEGKAIKARLKELLDHPSIDNLNYIAIAQLMLF